MREEVVAKAQRLMAERMAADSLPVTDRYMELVALFGRIYTENPRVADALIDALKSSPQTGCIRISFREGKPHSATTENVVY